MPVVNSVGNALTGLTGTGAFVGSTSPALVTPALGTPTSGVLTNCTGLPLGGVTFAPITQVITQTITATGAGTYTPTAGMDYCIIELQGGGGGSGGTTGTAGQGAMSGAGASGGYLRILATAAQIGASAAVSVGVGGAAGASGVNPGGDGGDTTITIGGSTWTADGGGGGTGQAASASAQQSAASGTPSSNTTGANATLIVNISGNGGSEGFSPATAGTAGRVCAVGPSSQLGSAQFTFSVNGNAYGGAASGYHNVGGANSAGQPGGQGIIIITEFLSV